MRKEECGRREDKGDRGGEFIVHLVQVDMPSACIEVKKLKKLLLRSVLSDRS